MRGIKYVLMLVAFLASFSLFSQESKQIKTRKKMLEKQEEAKAKAVEKETEARLKRHKKIQTKETQKRMKKTAKKNKQYNNHKKKFFLFRWFD